MKMKELGSNEEAFELAGIESEPEIYTFSDFCIDREILSPKNTRDLHHLRSMWDICGEEYLDYCKANKLEFEVIR